MREIMPREGLELLDGNRVEKGSWIGVPAQAIHMDERFYERPEVYDPWRFAREWEGRGGGGVGRERYDATQPTDTFLGFSYGRHAW